MKIAKVLLCVAVLAAIAMPSLADGLSEQMKAQNKLLSQRAARADAIRKLAERIKGLNITSETKVKDFVTESDTIQTAMTAFLSGMKETNIKYQEDGTCEVSMDVTLVTVITELKELHTRFYKGSKYKATDFEQMTQTNQVSVIKETGMGAPRPNWTPEAVFEPVRGASSYDSLDYMGAKAKAFWLANVQPQGRLGAVRAARVDGMRKLVERIKGVQVDSRTLVRDFVTEKDEINTLSVALLRGAREKSVRYHEDELIVEVEMEVTLQTVYECVKSSYEAHYKGDKARINEFEQRTQTVKKDLISETGMGVPNPKYVKEEVRATVEIIAEAAPKWPAIVSTKGNAAIDASNENAAQAKLMAFRGAELDARRKIAEEIDGLMISSKTSVHDFVTQNDEIETAMLTFQQGASVVEGSQRVLEDGSVEVTVELNPAQLWDIVTYYQKKMSIKLN